MTHIFISYSRTDMDYVQKLEQRLLSEGFTVWRDNHIQSGDAWWQVVKANLRDCAAMIVVMSPRAALSPWVLRETAIADFLNKPVFPLLLKGEPTGDAWSIYAFIHHTDVRDAYLPSTSFYDHLERYAPRRKLAGGVRVDGIYLCESSNPLFKEALRFYADETVTTFILGNDDPILYSLGNDAEQLAYTVDEDSIQFVFRSGRDMIARFKDDKLSVRVTYPNGQKDSRWYTFMPFEE
ncbi:MAG: toll/interleukin-1 receptor domain-containing protein [Phototrophicaceae bacterium]